MIVDPELDEAAALRAPGETSESSSSKLRWETRSSSFRKRCDASTNSRSNWDETRRIRVSRRRPIRRSSDEAESRPSRQGASLEASQGTSPASGFCSPRSRSIGPRRSFRLNAKAAAPV
jgi:hypothetical protein